MDRLYRAFDRHAAPPELPSAAAAASGDACWQAWEPAEWVASRGHVPGCESTHFACRWGLHAAHATHDSSSGGCAFSEAEAARLLGWLEAAWALLCSRHSPQRLAEPYATPGWCADGCRRKLNVYITGTVRFFPVLFPFPRWLQRCVRSLLLFFWASTQGIHAALLLSRLLYIAVPPTPVKRSPAA